MSGRAHRRREREDAADIEAKRTGRNVRVTSINDDAREAGIPKALRQYARRYGSSVEQIVQTHRQFDVPMLDHYRDRAAAAGGKRLPPYFESFDPYRGYR
jgi:hypothetical protein